LIKREKAMRGRINKVRIKYGSQFVDYQINLPVSDVAGINKVLATIPKTDGVMTYDIETIEGIIYSSFVWKPASGSTAIYYKNNVPYTVTATCCNKDCIPPDGSGTNGNMKGLDLQENLGDGTYNSPFSADTIIVSYDPAIGVNSPITIKLPDVTNGNGEFQVFPNNQESMDFGQAIINKAIISGAVGNTVTIEFRRT